MPTTPSRSSRSQRRPATHHELDGLLHELDIRPPGTTEYKLVSRWAAKHVWRIDAGGHPWAYVRYLLGPATRFPDRWRHLRLGELLYEARIGPRILGLTPESEALGGRAAVVEAGLHPLPREELEARADEAVALLTRLHTYEPLYKALCLDLNDVDLTALHPLATYLRETHERWFDAVMDRWREAGLHEINVLSAIVEDLFEQLETIRSHTGRIGVVVAAHNDPNHGNFMVNRQGALRLIDFEELGLNNPVADLGVFLTWYVDADRHFELLAHYPLADPRAILGRMRVWVPLRYLNVAAHWAARMVRARDEGAWTFAVDTVDEWLRGACELVFDGTVPAHLDALLESVRSSLLARGGVSWGSTDKESG
jgi:hypothetical protein